MDHDHMDHNSHIMDHGTTMDHSAHETTMDPNMDHGHDHDMNMGGHDMSGMAMYFHTNIGNDYVLFFNWKPNTAGG